VKKRAIPFILKFLTIRYIKELPMAIIYQKSLFSWKDVNELGDLERLKLVVESMPDEKLMCKLEQERGHGRNRYPVRPVWNSILAGIIFQHASIESLRRELLRNAQLREMCGFEPLFGIFAVPSSMCYSRFLVKLIKNQNLIDQMFNGMVESIRKILPDFAKEIAFDGKAISSLALGRKSEESIEHKRDFRKENDADWGVKKYQGKDEEGKAWEKVKSWFGFRLHLIVDANYELPISYQVTKASLGEQPVMRELFMELAEKHPDLIEDCDSAMGDKGYDGTETVSLLWDKYKIKPIIDIKKMWKDGEETRLLQTREIKNVTYDYKGTIYCHCPKTAEIRKMGYGGFEKERETLRYLCPAKQYGIECKGAADCPLRGGLRIPLKENRRIFTPVARSSYKWKRLYDKRTSVERVNSRIDLSFGFERHFIRGLEKMRMRCGLALCVMLAIALGRAKQNQHKLLRSLVKAA
jgi:Transposase DDE domain/Transposase domain (DUF772)